MSNAEHGAAGNDAHTIQQSSSKPPANSNHCATWSQVTDHLLEQLRQMAQDGFGEMRLDSRVVKQDDWELVVTYGAKHRFIIPASERSKITEASSTTPPDSRGSTDH